jgi:hypothetical protein
MVRLAMALAVAAAIILSAPVVQQAFAAVNGVFPSIAVAATAVPIVVAVGVAAARIRHRRRLRWGTLAAALAIGGAYSGAADLSATETFHFVEYGVLSGLFYLAVRPEADGTLLILPVLAAVAVGVVDEWFQWFVPIRAGELRDVVLDSICGVLFAIAMRPPPRLTLRLERKSRSRLEICAASTLALVAAFVSTVHIGHQVQDPEIGTFLSRYRPAQLSAFANDRGPRWRTTPPVAIRRFSREDQYLSEGLWHVQRRNQAWASGDIGAAWRENLILEKFFSPVLDTQSYASTTPPRWAPEQRADAASRPGVDRQPRATDDYRWPVYVSR